MTLLRSLLFNLFFFVATLVLTLVPATIVRFLAPGRVLDVARMWARVILWGLRAICGIRLRVSGLEHLTGGAALIASQHQSAFDTFVWLILVPHCCYVLKRELVRIPLLGPLMPLAGMIAVDRVGGGAALRGLLRQGVQAARQGRQIVIFPEGTRAPPGTVLPLQPGVAALAAQTGLAITPVVTDSGRCWGRRAFHKRPGIIHIRILEPISAALPRAVLMQRLDTALHSDPVENSVGRVSERLGYHCSQNT